MKLSEEADSSIHRPLHEPLVFRGGIGLRQEILSHQRLEIRRRSIDGRRLQAEVEVPRNRVVAVHAVLHWQTRGLIPRQCRVLRAICCVDVGLIHCKKVREERNRSGRKSFRQTRAVTSREAQLTLNLTKVSIPVAVRLVRAVDAVGGGTATTQADGDAHKAGKNDEQTAHRY
jgi:hypothetical protein